VVTETTCFTTGALDFGRGFGTRLGAGSGGAGLGAEGLAGAGLAGCLVTAMALAHTVSEAPSI
jgi:hypothetical protein